MQLNRRVYIFIIVAYAFCIVSFAMRKIRNSIGANEMKTKKDIECIAIGKMLKSFYNMWKERFGIDNPINVKYTI